MGEGGAPGAGAGPGPGSRPAAGPRARPHAAPAADGGLPPRAVAALAVPCLQAGYGHDGLAFSSDGRELHTFAVPGSVRCFDAATGAVVPRPRASPAPGAPPWTSPDGRWTARADTGGAIRTLSLVDARTDRVLRELPGMTAPVAWLPSRGLLAAAQKEPCAIAFVEPETGRVVRALPAGRFVVALAFSPDERRMAVSNESGLSIRDAETGADLVVPSGQEDLQLSDRASLRSPRAAQTGASKMAALVERGAPRDFRDIYTMREGIEAIGIRELAGMLAS